MHHLVKTVTQLSDRGAGLQVLIGQGARIDTTTAAGRLSFGMEQSTMMSGRGPRSAPIPR